MIECIQAEKDALVKEYKYWTSYIAESNIGKIAQNKKLEIIKKRLFEITKLPHSYYLEESSLSRIQRHISGDSAAQSWGTISAERYAMSDEENRERTQQLKKDLRDMGHGFVELEGGWRECQEKGTPYSKCPEDKLENTVETSFFIPNISREEIESLRDKYEQDAVIYGDKKSKGNALLLNNDNTVDNLGKFSAETAGTVLAQGYSKMRNGRKYVFRDTPEDDPSKITRNTDFKQSMSGKNRETREANRQKIRQMYNQKILNPQTNKMILVKTALKYGQAHPAYNNAMQLIRNNIKNQ